MSFYRGHRFHTYFLLLLKERILTMAFTVEDAYRETNELYHLTIVAGKDGLTNSISWVYQIEDTTIIQHLWGKELAVTMGISFHESNHLYYLIEELIKHNASGLIINTGKYIQKISPDVIKLCNNNHFPLITVPWEILLADLIKDYCIRSFHVEHEEQQLSRAFMMAIESPGMTDAYSNTLSATYNIEGMFQVALITSTDYHAISAIRRRRLLFYMQNALDKTDYTYNLFWYQDSYALVMNDVSEHQFEIFLKDLLEAASIRSSKRQLSIGLGTPVNSIVNLSKSYKRADAALHMSIFKKETYIRFSDMGIYQILFSVDDNTLLKELYESTLAPLKDYDTRHHSSYEDTLYYYLKYNGSIQAISEAMFTHRNTVLYRIKKMKELLSNDLVSAKDRFPYEMAFYIKEIL